MTTVYYGKSGVAIDVCSHCMGAWLDREEFDRIIAHLARTVDSKTAEDYINDVKDEFVEVFVGPEGAVSELQDLAKVLYLLQLRFVIEHPHLMAGVRSLPKG